MIHSLLPLVLLLYYLTAVYASALTFSDEMEENLNNILIPPNVANHFLSVKSKNVAIGGRHLKNCGSGTSWEEKWSGDDCNSCVTGRYQNLNSHKQGSCKGMSFLLLIFILLIHLTFYFLIFYYRMSYWSISKSKQTNWMQKLRYRSISRSELSNKL